MQLEKGRKLPPELENPVDNFLLLICSRIHPFFKQMGFTANGITILSGILQVCSVILLWQTHYVASSILYMIGYTLDVLDGYYARTYSMVSSYGDLLDHTKDTVVTFGLHMVIIFHPMIPLSWKIGFLVVSFMLSVFTAMYLGCQESYYEKWSQRSESTFLAPFRNLCTKDDLNRLTLLRWGGTGTIAAFYSLYIISLKMRI